MHGRICHIWRPKLRGQFFKRTRQSENRDLYYLLVGFVYSAIFLPKIQNQITFNAEKILIWKILKWNQLFLYLIYLKRAVWYCIYLGICISRPPAQTLAPNLCLPALAPNFYLPALVSLKPGLADTNLVPPICIYWPWPTIFITVLWICIYLLIYSSSSGSSIISNSSNFLGLHNTNISMPILVN